MKIETALNHERRLAGHASEIFQNARIMGQSHREILDRITARVYSDPAWQRLPSWATSRIEQRIRTEHDNVYKPDLSANQLERLLSGKDHRLVPYVRWQLRLDNHYVTSDELSAMRAAGDEGVWRRVEGTHIWNHNWKPYSPWHSLNAAAAESAHP